VRAFLKQIMAALMLLEKAGVIHCDLKPENILLQTE
jgi:serine/threonine protein kinase